MSYASYVDPVSMDITNVTRRELASISMQTENFEEILMKEYGPLMGGEDLRRALGYRTWSAFARAVRMGGLGVAVFEIAGRRGKFAFTRDVAKWLQSVGTSQSDRQTGEEDKS